MGNKIVKTSFYVTCILFVGFILSFVKEMVIADKFGVSAEVDAYVLAISIPINLFAIMAVSIQSIVIPIYSKVLYNEGNENAKRYIDSFITLIILVSALLIVLIEILAEPISFLFAPGLDSYSRGLAVQLLRITAPTILFTMLDRVFIGMLNVHKSIVLPSLSLYLLNISVIVIIVLFHAKWGIVSACIGQVVGSIAQVAFLIYIANKYYAFSICENFSNKYLKQTLTSIIPIMWSTSISEVNVIVNRIVASFLSVGAISAIGYSTKVNSVLIMFFTSAIATIVYPMYAEASVKKDLTVLNHRINMTLSVYVYTLLPLMTAVFILRRELIELAFARGAFDDNAVSVTQSLLGYYCIGIVFIAIRETITKVFYSLEDTKTPAINSSIGVMLNILLCTILPMFMGVQGVALASSLSAIFISLSLIVRLLLKHPEINISYFYSNLRQIIPPLIIMIICELCIYTVLSDISSIIRILCCCIVGLLSYIFTSHILNVQTYHIFIDKILKRS